MEANTLPSVHLLEVSVPTTTATVTGAAAASSTLSTVTTLTVPTLTVPTLTVPNITVPTPTVPILPAPSVTISLSSAPIVAAPTISTPTVTAPTLTGSVNTHKVNSIKIIEWKDGIGTLPGSKLRFKLSDYGTLELCDDDKPSESSDGSGKTSNNLSIIPLAECTNCGRHGLKSGFIRNGRFCSQTCATRQSESLKIFNKNSANNSANNLNNNDNNNNSNSSDAIKPDFKKKKLYYRGGRMYADILPDKLKTLRPFTIQERTDLPGRSGTLDGLDLLDAAFQEVENRETTPDNPSSDSVKLSRPSSASLFHTNNTTTTTTNNNSNNNVQNNKNSYSATMSTLHQAIYSLRMNPQPSCESPIAWEKHSKSLLSFAEKVSAGEVLQWGPEKVSQFVSVIPGCQDFGSRFEEEMIDGEAFLLLNQTDLVSHLGIKLGPAVKIYNSILVIRGNIEA